MRKSFLLFILAFSITSPMLAQQSTPDSLYSAQKTTMSSGAVITNYEAKGNLATTHELDCIPLESIKNEYTAADLYNAVKKCTQKADYNNASALFALAGAYVRFDIMRVTDKTAHQARTVLIMNSTSKLTAEQKKAFQAEIDKFAPDSKQLVYICEKIKKIGKPDYYPAYMIQHGMGAFSKEKTDPIVSEFNAEEAWESVLDKALHCK